MTKRVFKVHTDTFGRLVECIKKAMYGVTNKAITKEMPKELLSITHGDIVFISEKEVSNNALFGPFYVVEKQDGVVGKNRKGAWIQIDTDKSLKSKLAYWVEFENRDWCILFDKTLIDKISIVQPWNWSTLRVNLPSWGLVSEPDASKLLDFAVANEQDAKEFMKRHDVW